jgi:hypothetical protein
LFGYEIEVFFIPVYVICEKKKIKKKKKKKGQECPQKRPKMPTPFLLLAHKKKKKGPKMLTK